MNPANRCHLEGVIQGEAWTRWRAPKQGVPRGQVRFWLRVSRLVAGDGGDCLLCAIEPHDEFEVRRYEGELRDGRAVSIEAHAQRTCGTLFEDAPGVIFVAEACAFDGATATDVPARRHHAHGKMAAAGDELPLEGATP